MPTNFEFLTVEAPDILAVHWGWVVALGIAVGLLGSLAIMRANIATAIAVRLLGFLIFMSGVAVLLFSFATQGYWIDFLVHILWASLIVAAGLALLMWPTIGAEAITVIIAIYFFAEGMTFIGFAFASHIDGMWIFLIQGMFAMLLGGLLMIGWPVSGLWAIGTFIGIDLLFKGAQIIALGLGLRAISEGSIF